MIAFTVFWWPIYRYGIMYLVSFLWWYYYLQFIGRRSWVSDYPRLQKLLTSGLDDLLMMLVLGVILGWRLWDVFLYNRPYYAQHPDQILAIRNGGMSFVGGFMGVAFVVFLLKKTKWLSVSELFVLFDIIVFFLPLGILFGRVGNSLNQELYGKEAAGHWLLTTGSWALENLHIVRIYDKIDNLIRRNTNLFEGFFEGCMLFVVNILLFWKKLLYWIYKPGSITWTFCVLYGIIRFFLETLRDNPPSEYRNGILKSQMLMLWMIILGIVLLILVRKWSHKFDNRQ